MLFGYPEVAIKSFRQRQLSSSVLLNNQQKNPPTKPQFIQRELQWV
ncbi:hypothetical protein FM107_01730 [Sphingobacterium sp. JB170]|nr:hypothetical protein FM107_01730 [Sphingobacterium sp. JB170]